VNWEEELQLGQSDEGGVRIWRLNKMKIIRVCASTSTLFVTDYWKIRGRKFWIRRVEEK
jgi:hypothetical protein